MPIPKAQEVKLSDTERQGLEKLVKRHQVGQQIALRARIVLAAADGLKNKEIVIIRKSVNNGVLYKDDSEKCVLSTDHSATAEAAL